MELKFFLFILLKILSFIFSNNSNSLQGHRKNTTRLLAVQDDWVYSYKDIYSNQNLNPIQSYFKIKNLNPFITYQKDSKIYLSFGADLKIEIQPFKNIVEVLKQSETNFYICLENSKRFYNLETNGISSTNVRLTEVFDDTNDSINRIVCSKSSKDTKLIIGYIGWNKIKVFDPVINGFFLIYNNDKENFLAINLIYPNTDPEPIIDEYVEILIFSMNKENLNYYITKIFGSNGIYTTKSYFVEVAYSNKLINDQIIISSTIDKRFAIVVSYNTLTADQVNVYFHNFNQLTKYMFNLKELIPDAVFELIRFIKQTEYITFKASINNQVYIGLINLYARKIQFLKKFESITNVIFTNDYQNFINQNIIDNKASFLIIKDSTVSALECPFTYENYNQDTQSCVFTCQNFTNYGLNLDPINGNSCLDCTKNTISKYFEQGYCVPACSSNGFLDKEKNDCIICMNRDEDVYTQFNETLNKNICVKSCYQNYLINPSNFRCYMCNEINQFYYNGICNLARAEKAECDDKKICTICANTQKKYFFKNLTNIDSSYCLDKCSINMIEKDLTCELCPINTYKIDNECIQKCPIYGIVLDENLKVCKTCSSEQINKYLYKGNCIDSCPLNYFSDKYNICYRCDEIQSMSFMILSSKLCIDKCPSGSVIDVQNKICDVCKDRGKFLNSEKTKCVDACLNYELFNQFNECYNCNLDNGKYFFEGNCIQKCPDFTETNNDFHLCNFCKKQNKFLLNSKCQEKCEDYIPYDLNNVCYECKNSQGIKGFYYEKICYDKCPKGTRTDTSTKNYFCENCKLLNKFYDPLLNICVDKCPNESFYDETNTCYFCKDLNKFYFSESPTCLNDCPEYTEKDINNFKCITCQKEKFVENNKCVDNCSDASIYRIVNATKVCQKCPKGELSTTDNTCVSGCPGGYKFNKDKNLCEDCRLVKKVLFKVYNCIFKEECDSNLYYYDNKNNTCVDCADLNQFYFHGECKNTCDPLIYSRDIEKYRCYNCSLLQKDIFLDLDSNKCVENCPKNTELRDNYKCFNCLRDQKFAQKGKCESKCSDFLFTNYTDNTCQECPLDNNYFFKDENKCISDCRNLKLSLKDNLKQCTYYHECQKNGTFLYVDGFNINSKPICIKECPEGYQKNLKNECNLCSNSTDRIYYKDGECVNNCGVGYVIESPKNICRKCEFILENKCEKNCYDFYRIQNPITKICEKCSNYTYFYEGKCVDFCPPESTPIYETWSCQKESKISKICYGDKSPNQEGSCNCEGENRSGKYCQINYERNNKNNSFWIESFQDNNYTNFYIFQIKLKNKPSNKEFNNTVEYIPQKNITEIIWKFNEVEKAEYNGMYSIRVKLIDLNKYTNEVGLIVKAIIKSKGKSESFEILINKNNEINLEKCFNLTFENLISEKSDKLNFDNVNILNKIRVNVDDTRCLNEKINGINYDPKNFKKNYIMKFHYTDLSNKLIKLTNYIQEKSLIFYLPDFEKIVLHIKSNRGSIYRLEIKNLNKNDHQKINVIPAKSVIDILKGINDNTIKINALNNYISNIEIKPTNYKDIGDFLISTIRGGLDSFYKSSIIDSRIIFTLIDNYVSKLNPFPNKTHCVDQTSNLNRILHEFSRELNSNRSLPIIREDYPYFMNTADKVFNQLIINYKHNSELKDITTEKRNLDNYDTLQNMLKNFITSLSYKLYKNEKISIEFENFISKIDRLVDDQESIFFNHPKKVAEVLAKDKIKLQMVSYRNLEESLNNSATDDLEEIIKSEIKKQETECDYTTSSICSTNEEFSIFKQFLNITNLANVSNIAIISNIVNNKLLAKDNNPMQNDIAMNFFAYDINNNKTLNTKNNLLVTVSFSGKNYSSNAINNTSCISRLEFDQLKNSTEGNKDLGKFQLFDCLGSKFDYEKNLTICICRTSTEVFSIQNSAIARIQKLLQYKIIDYNLGKNFFQKNFY